jgi:hypothetical protein
MARLCLDGRREEAEALYAATWPARAAARELARSAGFPLRKETLPKGCTVESPERALARAERDLRAARERVRYWREKARKEKREAGQQPKHSRQWPRAGWIRAEGTSAAA